MGKGDKRTKKGKVKAASFGNARKQRTDKRKPSRRLALIEKLKALAATKKAAPSAEQTETAPVEQAANA
ncbi:MAG: 30S ribosomal protein THX [Deltaproteobacteria bacterium]|nr:30S ribosomal protein THX [Deltaproteobacteria bacterium]